ncbi:MAG TPA: glycosyltransferase [Streptosporangiaceae bacterium]|nr:glycosyltransferase [Streptosporangiaceae bacterium]
MSAVDAFVRGFAWFSIWYFVVLNTIYLFLIALAAFNAIGSSRRTTFSGLGEIFHSPLAPGISVVVPVRNMEDLIVGSTRGLLNLRYPRLEIIVVDDGSTDGTFWRLQDEFGLVEVEKVIRRELDMVGRVFSVHAPSSGERLLVIRKESMGRPADAVNTGVNAAQYPLICRIDADTYLDESALLSLAKPFVEDPVETIAAGATIRVANGCVIRGGRVVVPRVPGGWLPTVQAAEYLRAFLLGRAGWSQVRGMLFISGAFGLFRRDVYELVGGFHLYTEGDDLEMTTSIHHRLRDDRRRYRIAFVPEPCSWTIVPSRYKVLAHQRARWSQILSEALWIHKVMLFNPRYGGVGLVVLPFYLLFELIGAFVELLAVIVFILGWAVGILNPAVVLLFVAAGLGYATFLTIISVITEEITYHRYGSWRDFALLIYGAVAENFGFRQIYTWWRVRGVVDAILRRKATWLEAPAGTPDVTGPQPGEPATRAASRAGR